MDNYRKGQLANDVVRALQTATRRTYGGAEAIYVLDELAVAVKDLRATVQRAVAASLSGDIGPIEILTEPAPEGIVAGVEMRNAQLSPSREGEAPIQLPLPSEVA